MAKNLGKGMFKAGMSKIWGSKKKEENKEEMKKDRARGDDFNITIKKTSDTETD